MYIRSALLFLVILFSCNSPPDSTFSDIAMTMDYRIVIGEQINHQTRKRIEEIISETFNEVDNTFNLYNPFSELSKLNALPSNETIEISEAMERLLVLTKKVVSLTHGLFDPTISPLYKLWFNSLIQKGSPPSKKEIANKKKAVGWEHISLKGRTFSKNKDVVLDLAGIAKGHCIDLITERLQKEGFQNLYVSWGGEIRTTGHHPTGRPWQISIRGVNKENRIATLPLKNQAIATSGDYLQPWTVIENGKAQVYTHIIHPSTGAPLQIKKGSIASVSFVCTTCAMADAFATAAMVMGDTQTIESWAEELKKKGIQVQIWIATRLD